jgi:FAD/FMN-containing dehydrogenase
LDFKQIKLQVAKIVGERYVSDAPKDLTVYSRDYSSMPPQIANLVAAPGCTEEVAAIMRIANRNGINVTVRGGATTAHLCTAKEGIILDLNRMNKILKIDEEGCLYLTAQGGTPIYTITQELDKRGFELAGRPMFGPVASIGAWVNTVGIGANCAKYGYFSEHVTGVEAVLPTGEIVRTGVNSLQNCDPIARYTHACDLTGLFVGARGSMGVITEVSTRFFPKPKYNDFVTLGYTDDNIQDMIRACNMIFKEEIPDTIDINDDGVANMVGLKLPVPHLISMTIGGMSEAEVQRKVELCKEIGKQTGGLDLGQTLGQLLYWGGALNAYTYKQRGAGHLVFIDSYWHALDAYPDLYHSFKDSLNSRGLTKNGIFGWFMKGVGCSFPVVAYREPDETDKMNEAWEEICDHWFSIRNSAPGMSVPSVTKYNLDPLTPAYYHLLRKIKDTVDPKNIMNSKIIPYAGRDE